MASKLALQLKVDALVIQAYVGGLRSDDQKGKIKYIALVWWKGQVDEGHLVGKEIEKINGFNDCS